MSKSVIDFVTDNFTSLNGMKVPPKYPPKIRLRQLRTERGLSMEKLAGMIGREKPLIYKLEKGLTRYNETVLNALAKALEVSPMELLADEADTSAAPRGLAEDAIPYDADNAAGGLPSLGPHEFAYEVKSSILNQIGLLPGDLAIFDMRMGFADRLTDGDVVIAQVYNEGDTLTAVTVLRQYLAPGMLVSNSSSANPPPLNTKVDDVAIKGVMTSSHRVKLRAPRH
ncbi:MAG: helix-turn-helix transcriptional regulator [Pseudomonadota bacterium]|nr:helix-turn-helix transcriptional regulator [Pseudomonadota bacterium]